MEMSFRTAIAAPSLHPSYVSRTFAEAAASYIEHGGEVRYLEKILPHLGPKHMAEIFPFDIRSLADKLYPTQSNATKNRCVVTPVRAICHHAYDRGWGPPSRIRNFREERPKRKKAASQAWLHAFVRQCEEDGLHHLAGLVLFMSQTGARISEAVALKWSEVDMVSRTALLLKTKTERNSLRHLTDQLVARLYKLREAAEPCDHVFRYKNRHAVNERIFAVCKRAKITYKSSHTCGRHAFANITLGMGIDIKSVMDAGGWRSTSIFLGVYVNPRNAGRIVADRHNLYQYESDL
ncbi:tyrosine-type recombinase/integrase [Neorhizobium alkalisoli]|uniref:Integrase n=1 Tax=Neorhizobium alkalisoli TaxID=528178 RepID=A0A561QSB1_9HYPH|nr:tyrosine-type recombinase/integrase [Neorhizobium alkalisoli]TWF53283.1 integrase [Neorhizobium alkalisoli]